MRKDIVADWRERRRHAQEQLRMRDELQYAREIQLSMLPDSPPSLDWIDLAGFSMPATEVGGDYFDYFVIDGEKGDRLAIVSGDVAGHGLAAGLVLAALRSGFTLLRDSLHDPAAVLRRLHTLVAETTRRRTLVTCAVLLLDRTTKRATLASAGHPPIIMARDGVAESMNLFAPPLGVRLPLNVPQREMSFLAGDVFVLHTDGVYEATNHAGENYGIERIESIVREHAGLRAYEICDAIVRDVQLFRGGAPQSDDVTVVVAKIA
jgi:sigma-B regulation protein RsbU (phosphoserine phosphatase)